MAASADFRTAITGAATGHIKVWNLDPVLEPLGLLRKGPPIGDLVTHLPHLLFRLVAARHAKPDLLHSLEPAHFWEAVHRLRPHAQSRDIPELARELESHSEANPLWLSWVKTTRERELKNILESSSDTLPTQSH